MSIAARRVSLSSANVLFALSFKCIGKTVFRKVSSCENPPTPSGRRRVRVKSVYALPEVFARGQSLPGKSRGGWSRGVLGIDFEGAVLHRCSHRFWHRLLTTLLVDFGSILITFGHHFDNYCITFSILVFAWFSDRFLIDFWTL